MYQSGRAGDEAKKRKSPTKSGRVGIHVLGLLWDLLRSSGRARWLHANPSKFDLDHVRFDQNQF